MRFRIFKNKFVITGLIILASVILTAVLAPLAAPYDPLAQDLSSSLQSPSIKHPFGQDKLGRDVLSRVIYGSRISVWVGLVTVGISLAIGLILGLVAGYLGGIIDELLMRLIDILLAFPGILLAIALMAVLGPSLNNVVLTLSAIGWVGYARLVRGQTLAVKNYEYVSAAVALGASKKRIIFRHILPNILGPLIIQVTFGLAGVIVAEAGLSFLGLGTQPPTPSWGNMLSEGTQFLLVAPYLSIFPGLAIVLLVMGLNFIGDGLRDSFDPHGKM